MKWDRVASRAGIEKLKAVLENIGNPEALNEHPWTRMHLVTAARAKNVSGFNDGAGRSLLWAVTEVFETMRPSVPPRRSLRLDTRWGEFGLLAARYFAPLKFGTPFPASLRDAWGRIDPSILLFVFGSADGSLSMEQKERFSLVGNESDVAPISTLSDWHTHGIRRLAELILKTEARLERAGDATDIVMQNRKAIQAGAKRWRGPARIGGMVIAIVAAILVAGAGLKAYRLYTIAGRLKTQLQSLEQVASSAPTREAFRQLPRQLTALDIDLETLDAEVRPYLWMAPFLQWLPVYGGDVTQAEELLDLAQHMTNSAQAAVAGATILEKATSYNSDISVSDLGSLLWEARPQLLLARSEAAEALAARGRIDAEALSPDARRLLTERMDPVTQWWLDGLSLAIAAPPMIGAGDVGPQTYLILVQNEDELRPSGGFITAVGKAVLDQGSIVDLSFQDSGDLDNWAMPYPIAPWQLSEYMNSRVLVLRDANWFPDFPLASLYVEQLYAYTHKNSVDGIVAIDQHLLVMLLGTLGPVQVDSVDYPIDADNVIEYMRQAKSPPVGEPLPAGWTNKAFIGPLAEAILDKALNAEPQEWTTLARTLLQAMDERHLQLQVDDPDAARVLAQHGWNGGLRSDAGDFLMVLDSNVGFNKTNAVVQTRLGYDVNLADRQKPTAELFVSHTNGASADVPCLQWNANGQIQGEKTYPIDRCYWDYMRIYVPQGTQLISGTPQGIPPEWMILNRTVSPTIDELDEGLQGIDSFGTLIVVPGGKSVNSGLTLALPADRIVTEGPGHLITYDLTVRKQPGTLAIPLTVRIHLPNGAAVESPAPGWVVQGNNILIETDLRVDRHFEIKFRLP